MGLRAAVIGSGSWGTALAWLLARTAERVSVWDVDPQVLADIATHHRNVRYLPDLELPASVVAESDLGAAVREADVVVMSVPACAVAEAARLLGPVIPSEATVVSATKGLCPLTGRRMTVTIAEEASLALERVVALSGPNLAREIAVGAPTATVASGSDRCRLEAVRAAFGGPLFRVYTNEDTIGVELGGALKNVMAIGAGINDGLGYGDNTKATVLTRGLAEMTRLAVALGARAETLRGLSGLGDLVATSVSPKSRNYRVGFALGKGESLESILASLGQVAEGVPTAHAVQALARRLEVEAPITDAICGVLSGALPPLAAVEALMSRAGRDELLDEPAHAAPRTP